MFNNEEEFLHSFNQIIDGSTNNINRINVSVDQAKQVLQAWPHYADVYKKAFLRFTVDRMLQVAAKPLYESKWLSLQQWHDQKDDMLANGWEYMRQGTNGAFLCRRHLSGPRQAVGNWKTL